MNEIKLTDEQVERAAEAWYRTAYPNRSNPEHPAAREQTRMLLRAAAPYLQAPWKEPSLNECYAINKHAANGFATVGLREFVERRNAALLPKPVDPRREKIVNILSHGVSNKEGGRNWWCALSKGAAENAADSILAALDGEK